MLKYSVTPDFKILSVIEIRLIFFPSQGKLAVQASRRNNYNIHLRSFICNDTKVWVYKFDQESKDIYVTTDTVIVSYGHLQIN